MAVLTTYDQHERSGHFHKEDWHYLYVISGLMRYSWKTTRGIKVCYVRPGQCIYTPPRVEHWTGFFGDEGDSAVALSISARPRDPEHYDADTVHLDGE